MSSVISYRVTSFSISRKSLTIFAESNLLQFRQETVNAWRQITGAFGILFSFEIVIYIHLLCGKLYSLVLGKIFLSSKFRLLTLSLSLSCLSTYA